MKGKKRVKKNTVFKRMVKIWLLVFAVMLAVLLGIVWFQYGTHVVDMAKSAKVKVDESTYDTFRASQTSLVYDADGNLLKSLKGEKDVYYLTIESIPEYAKEAVISVEDKKFYQHGGVDLMANIRAMLALVKNRGEIKQGGSTITQQLARGVFLTYEVSWERKIAEMFIARELEKKYTKDEILEFYLNTIYYSNGYYGIQAASNGYFNRSVNSLSLSQIAFLSAIPNSPTMYDPYTNIENTLKRRDVILNSMLEDEVITQEEYDEAIAEEIKVVRKKTKRNNYVETYIYDCATKALMKANGFRFKYQFASDSEKEIYQDDYDNWYSMYQKSLYTGGYRIYTSIEMDKQKMLQDSVDTNLASYTETNDEGVYRIQGAAASIDNETGRIVAIVGGRSQDTEGYTLNRAYQSYRQPGSTIKPLIVYTPALERGYTANSRVPDIRFAEGEGPKNSGDTYSGWISMREAVERSRNTVAWRLFEEITPRVGVEYLAKMHFANLSPVDYHVQAASLGGLTYGSNVVEMASGYACLVNDGVWREPTCIVKILSSDGSTVVKDDIETTVVYEENAARQMVDILEGVLVSGTGASIGGFYNIDSAAKTGTTDSSKDGWFCGMTPYYTTAVWVGNDENKEVYNLYGGNTPGYIWKQYMNAAHEGLGERHFATYSRPESSKDYESDELVYYYEEEVEESDSGEETGSEEESGEVEEPISETEIPVVTEPQPDSGNVEDTYQEGQD